MTLRTQGADRIRFLGADCFIYALNHSMRRNGQNRMIGQTVIEFDRSPDVEAMRAAIEDLFQRFPLLHARIRRSLFTPIPEWHPLPLDRGNAPFATWGPDGAGRRATTALACSESILNEPLSVENPYTNARFDLFCAEGGAASLASTWSHILFDGKGAELLLTRLISPHSTPPEEALLRSLQESYPEASSAWQQILAARPFIRRVSELGCWRVRSITGPKMRSSPLRFDVQTLSAERSAGVHRHAAKIGCKYFPMLYFLAATMRGFHRLFESRGIHAEHFVAGVPIQTHAQSSRISPFRNQVTLLFFSFRPEHLVAFETAVEWARREFSRMVRLGIEKAFSHMMSLNRYLPAPIHIPIASMHFGGELFSFYHSYTGAMHFGADTFCGAKIINAYHIPAVSWPPGCGLFFNDFGGRLNVVRVWRDGAVTADGLKLLLDTALADLEGTSAESTMPVKTTWAPA